MQEKINFSTPVFVWGRLSITYFVTIILQETSPERVEKESPYLLFYERIGLDYKQFQPDIQDRNPDCSNDEEEFNYEVKKACVLQ